ncbi:MAG: hypothetical protein H0X37_14625 [Herpetosiphonaceae bacterium]|nr:hypothetical protein [Herpetosiphonaceae bacterium]
MSTVYTLIIPNTTRTGVFLVLREQQWILPELTFEQQYFWQVVGQINEAVRERLGLEVTTLRCRSIVHDAPSARTELVYELEYHNSTEFATSRGHWIGPEALDELPLAQRPILAAWFEEVDRPSRVPWYRPGWRDTILSWLNTALNQSGHMLTGAVEQVRSWERASLWRAPTNLGVVYFKAVPSMFGHEPALTALLAERFPALIPSVLAVSATQGWLLLADAGHRRLMDELEIKHWERALRDYAGMQLMLTQHVDALHVVGVPDRGQAWLLSGLEQLVADTATLTQGPTGLSHDEITALHVLKPALQTACTTWEQSGLPLSLEHGDFSAWQIQIDGDTSRFLDWSDSSVAPPFFSLLGPLDDSASGLAHVPDAAPRLRDAYLSQWTEFATLHVLQRLFDVTQCLAPLHHALIYYLDILPSMEQRWEMEQMLPYYLRMLLI